MRKEIIEKILEEWNVCSCDNSALADRLLEEFSPAGEYIKKEDAQKGILAEFTKREEQELFVCGCADVKQTCADILDGLPTYSFPDSAEIKGEWVSVVDSYHKDGTPFESHWECSNCGSDRSGWGEFKFCPDCGADMRGVSE